MRGLVRLDTVAVDGTKIAANASLDANRDEQWVREQARKILEEAQATDQAEDELFGDARGDEPDPAMTDPGSREQAVREWAEELERVKRDRKRPAHDRDEQVERRKQELSQGNTRGGRYAGTLDQRVEQARIAWQSAVNAQQGKVQAYARAKAAGLAVRGPAPVPADRHVGVGRLKANYVGLLATAEAAAEQPVKPGRLARRFQVNTTDPSSPDHDDPTGLGAGLQRATGRDRRSDHRGLFGGAEQRHGAVRADDDRH